jgi:hypothetical protein
MQFFLSGKSAMAVGWPTASRSGDIKMSRHEPPRFVELPGSDVSFDFVAEQWVQRPRDEPRHVPVLAVAGRLGAITRQSRQISSAANLLGWLSGRQHSDTIGPRSSATTLFRQSHLTGPSRWVDPSIESAAAHEYGQLVARTQSRAEFVLAPRLPRQHLYMEALDTAVRQAVQGQVSPQEALHEAAQHWRQITAQLGLEAQRSAYHHSLGLD